MWKALLIALPLGGCYISDRPPVVPTVEVYTRAEIDAINAERACKEQARNMLQMARCSR